MTASNLPSLPADKGEWDETAVSRRGFLEVAFGFLAGIGVLAVVIPGVRFLVGNSLQPAKPQWVELGNADALAADQVTRVNYSTRATDAWRSVNKRGTVYVSSDDGGASYVALDGTCTHLGCIVHWKPDEAHFGCPCHQAAFSREGQVLSGPPPRPLRQLAVKIENGVLFAEI
jgi:Rieske Fe-S protein